MPKDLPFPVGGALPTDTVHVTMSGMHVDATRRTVTFSGQHEILLAKASVTVPFCVLEALVTAHLAARAQAEMKERGLSLGKAGVS